MVRIFASRRPFPSGIGLPRIKPAATDRRSDILDTSTISFEIPLCRTGEGNSHLMMIIIGPRRVDAGPPSLAMQKNLTGIPFIFRDQKPSARMRHVSDLGQ